MVGYISWEVGVIGWCWDVLSCDCVDFFWGGGLRIICIDERRVIDRCW